MTKGLSRLAKAAARSLGRGGCQPGGGDGCGSGKQAAARQQGASEPSGEARPRPLAAATAQDAYSDVGTAFELIPEAERLSWVERAKQKLREQGTPWLETCEPLLRALAFELWGLGIPVYPKAVIAEAGGTR